ncbi:hypothetical protein OPV22_008687 [Ensete ventricosum]|uniref:Uncharacterized protein n=1 Tax=Ensete ventricosum TaxID=4639 RepID=A0AAV8R9C0_ENSVE|nr:hypothetical protein OPV22_008687 [Ensete ventricosum]
MRYTEPHVRRRGCRLYLVLCFKEQIGGDTGEKSRRRLICFRDPLPGHFRADSGGKDPPVLYLLGLPSVGAHPPGGPIKDRRRWGAVAVFLRLWDLLSR